MQYGGIRHEVRDKNAVRSRIAPRRRGERGGPRSEVRDPRSEIGAVAPALCRRRGRWSVSAKGTENQIEGTENEIARETVGRARPGFAGPRLTAARRAGKYRDRECEVYRDEFIRCFLSAQYDGIYDEIRDETDRCLSPCPHPCPQSGFGCGGVVSMGTENLCRFFGCCTSTTYDRCSVPCAAAGGGKRTAGRRAIGFAAAQAPHGEAGRAQKAREGNRHGGPYEEILP